MNDRARINSVINPQFSNNLMSFSTLPNTQAPPSQEDHIEEVLSEENVELESVTNMSQVPHKYFALLHGNEIIAVHESSTPLEQYLEELLANEAFSAAQLFEWSLIQKFNLKFGISSLD